MDKKVLLDKVAETKRDVIDAESNLDKVLREIQTAPRADKTTITKVVEEAFTKLKAVRMSLAELETLMKHDDV